jgi:hypothetical protein
MTCKQVHHLLVACWGDIDKLEAPAAGHLAQCAECRREAEMLRLTHGLLSETEAAPQKAPKGFAHQTMARLGDARPAHASWRDRLVGWLSPPAPVLEPVRAAAFALALILVVGGGVALYHGAVPPEGIAPGGGVVVANAVDSAEYGPEAPIDFEALVLQHETLALTETLSEDAGVHLVSYRR